MISNNSAFNATFDLQDLKTLNTGQIKDHAAEVAYSS